MPQATQIGENARSQAGPLATFRAKPSACGLTSADRPPKLIWRPGVTSGALPAALIEHEPTIQDRSATLEI
jgi:hypothetical protein